MRCGRRTRTKAKGQATVETALAGLLLLLLLAAAVDFGRAFYTAIIVSNMAGEGAAYASIYPYRDADPANGTCEQTEAYNTIQSRARTVAQEHGLVVEQQDRESAQIYVYADGGSVDSATSCTSRCAGRTITVKVVYKLDDLLLPSFVGMNSITITKSASQVIIGGNSCGGAVDKHGDE